MGRPLAALLIGSLLAACGYQPVDPSRSLGPDLRAIEISLFENRSTEPGFERMLADALWEEFSRRGQLQPLVAGEGGQADLALLGVVRNVHVAPSSRSSVGLELEGRVDVVLEVSLLRSGTQELLWTHESLRLRELFLSSADAQVRESNKEQALRRIAAGVAGRIADEVAQTF